MTRNVLKYKPAFHKLWTPKIYQPLKIYLPRIRHTVRIVEIDGAASLLISNWLAELGIQKTQKPLAWPLIRNQAGRALFHEFPRLWKRDAVAVSNAPNVTFALIVSASPLPRLFWEKGFIYRRPRHTKVSLKISLKPAANVIEKAATFIVIKAAGSQRLALASSADRPGKGSPQTLDVRPRVSGGISAINRAASSLTASEQSRCMGEWRTFMHLLTKSEIVLREVAPRARAID